MSTAAQLQQLLGTMTPSEIVAAVNAAQASRVVPRAPLTVPTVSHGRVEKKTIKLTTVAKATRPLNSWMAFRSYYSTIFSDLPQKDISGFLTYMWRADPFKAKWSVLAKAYSVVRDEHGKKNIPLDAFLAINGPLLGIVEPQNYLQHLGWQVAVCTDGETILRRDSIVMDQETFHTNVSVNDVVLNTYQAGLCAGDVSKVLLKNDEAALSTPGAFKNAGTHKVMSIRRKKMSGTTHENTAFATYNGVESGKHNNTVIGTGLTQNNNNIALSNVTSTASSSRTSQVKGDNGIDTSANNVSASKAPHQRTVNPSINEKSQTSVESATTTSSNGLASTVGAASQTHHASAPVNNTPSPRATVPSAGAAQGHNAAVAVPATASANSAAHAEDLINSAFDPLQPAYVFDPFDANAFDAFELSGAWDDWINYDACAEE